MFFLVMCYSFSALNFVKFDFKINFNLFSVPQEQLEKLPYKI